MGLTFLRASPRSGSQSSAAWREVVVTTPAGGGDAHLWGCRESGTTDRRAALLPCVVHRAQGCFERGGNLVQGWGDGLRGPQTGAVPPRVHVTLVLHLAECVSPFEPRRPGPTSRVRSACPRQRLCGSRRQSSRPRPDQGSPIDPAQGRGRGQATPLLARPRQNQPSRLVDGVSSREVASLSRPRARDRPAPTTTRKPRLPRPARQPWMGRATGSHSAMG